MTREEAISKHIAAAIVRNTRKRWASLYADALEGIQMSETLNQGANNGGLQTDRPAFKPAADSTSMNVPSVVPIAVKYVDANEFDGDRGGDTRSQAQQPTMPAQSGPRDATGTKGA